MSHLEDKVIYKGWENDAKSKEQIIDLEGNDGSNGTYLKHEALRVIGTDAPKSTFQESTNYTRPVEALAIMDSFDCVNLILLGTLTEPSNPNARQTREALINCWKHFLTYWRFVCVIHEGILTWTLTVRRIVYYPTKLQLCDLRSRAKILIISIFLAIWVNISWDLQLILLVALQQMVEARVRAASKAQGDGAKRTRACDRAVRAFPAPEANAELQSNLDRRRLVSHANAMSKGEKFPPPHEDGGLGVPLGASHHINPTFLPADALYSSTSFTYSKEPAENWSGPLVDPASAGGARPKKLTAN